MKKWIAAILIAVVVFVSCIYIFIPSKIVVSNVKYIRAYQDHVLKFLKDSAMLNTWWHSVATPEDSGYTYKGYTYRVTKSLSDLVEISIKSPKINTTSLLVCVHIYLDSSAIQWRTEINTSANPFTRLSQYYTATDLKASMYGLMNSMKEYLDHAKNIYGIDVKEIQLKDSLLISSKIQTKAYPTVNEVYAQVNKLKDYAASRQATVTNLPMLNVTKLGPADYQVMVGVPINKTIAETNELRLKHMPYGGNMLTANIQGGDGAIQAGLEKLYEYMMDAKRTSPAIPFQLMITDRSAEPDTSKWITRLYYPVM